MFQTEDKRMRGRFPASAFCDCRDVTRLTAKEKAAIIRDWELFLVWRLNQTREALAQLPGTDYGVKAPRKFTRRLYDAFNCGFGYIAHFNINGFFYEQLLRTESFAGVMQAAMRQDPNHYNTWGAHYDTDDLNKAMQRVTNAYEAEIRMLLQHEAREDNEQAVAGAKALLEQQGFTVEKP